MQQEELFPDGQCGRTSQELCRPTKDEILGQSSVKWLKQGRFSKNTLSWMHNTSESPSDEGACSSSLSLILQSLADVPTRYYLSPKACEGILRRADRRQKIIPAHMRLILSSAATQTSL